MATYILIAGMIIALGVIFYVVRCNEQTFKDRIAMIEWASKAAGTKEFYERIELLKLATFNEHMWELIMRRDPTELYAKRKFADSDQQP